MNKVFTLILFLIASGAVMAQSITKLTSSVVSGTVCPGSVTYYEVSVPSDLTSCKINWSATNGEVTIDATNQRKASVVWVDTPGASGTIKATFISCDDEDNDDTYATKTELILSVKNQSWGSYGTSINVDYCTKAQKLITVPRMFVQGTGGIAQPSLTEVAYAWTLPSGWREVGTGRTGFFGTAVNSIYVEPTKCSVPGLVTVYGTLVGAGPFCNSAEKSATATISLNGANPVATVGPQPGYFGGSQCNTTPVTFYATTSVALGCVSGYSWAYPPSWTLISQSGNSITLQPSGTPSDSDPAHPIKATINFGCGSSIVSGGYVPPFTETTLTAPSIICYSSGSQFTLNNVPVGAAVTWAATPANLFTVSSGNFTGNGGNHNILLAPENSNASGQGTLTLTINAGCGNPIQVQQAFWTGPAQIQDIFYPSSTVAPHQLIPLSIDTDPGSSSGYYKAEIVRKFGGYNYTANGNVIEFSLPMTGTYNVEVYAYNACGWPQNFYPLVFFCTEDGSMFAVFPNPADNYVDIEMSDIDSKATEAETDLYQITLVDETGTEMLKTSSRAKKKRIDTSQLKKGQYVLRIQYKGQVALQRIIIDR